jgi:meiotic recombination protein SPO11
MLMPQPNTVASVQFRSTPYVLIIEKEAVFRSLIDAVAHADYPPVLITAKGYPDVATRIFCSLLSASASCPPVYMLVDYDPHGYSILSTYIHGSASLNDQDNQMIMSTAQLLGLRFDDIFGRNDDEILPLTPRDRQLARSMLQKNPAFSETNPDWQRQLQCMLLLNVKAEIQILGTGGELADFVSHRVASAVSKP